MTHSPPIFFLPPPSLDMDNKTTARLWAFWHKNEGLLIMVSAQLFFSLMNLTAKLMSQLDEPVPPLEVRYLNSTMLNMGSIFIIQVACRGQNGW